VHNCGAKENKEEHRIIPEAFKDIPLFTFKFSGIDFVKHLHKDEDAEVNSLVLTEFISPFVDVNSAGNVEKSWSVEEHDVADS
jgi:hypothetical protein